MQEDAHASRGIVTGIHDFPRTISIATTPELLLLLHTKTADAVGGGGATGRRARACHHACDSAGQTGHSEVHSTESQYVFLAKM